MKCPQMVLTPGLGSRGLVEECPQMVLVSGLGSRGLGGGCPQISGLGSQGLVGELLRLHAVVDSPEDSTTRTSD